MKGQVEKGDKYFNSPKRSKVNHCCQSDNNAICPHMKNNPVQAHAPSSARIQPAASVHPAATENMDGIPGNSFLSSSLLS